MSGGQCDPSLSERIHEIALPCATAACSGDVASLLSGLRVGSSVCDCVSAAATENLALAQSQVYGPAYPTADVPTPCEQDPSCQGSPSSGLGLEVSQPSATEGYPPTYKPDDPESPYSCPPDARPGPDDDTPYSPSSPFLTSLDDFGGTAPYPTREDEDGEWYPEPTVTEDEYADSTITAPPQLEKWLAPRQENPTSPPTTACSSEDCAQLALTSIPKCAQACFFDNASKVGCGPLNFACQCEPSARASMTGLMAPCVMTECWPWEYYQIIQGAGAVCECATGSCAEPGRVRHGFGAGRDSGPTKDCGAVAKTAIPTCAQPCISPLPRSVGCSTDDFECQCQEDAQASLSKLAVPCVLQSCGVLDIPSLIAGGSESKCPHVRRGGEHSTNVTTGHH